jgi:hypothetical protein
MGCGSPFKGVCKIRNEFGGTPYLGKEFRRKGISLDT